MFVGVQGPLGGEVGAGVGFLGPVPVPVIGVGLPAPHHNHYPHDCLNRNNPFRTQVIEKVLHIVVARYIQMHSPALPERYVGLGIDQQLTLLVSEMKTEADRAAHGYADDLERLSYVRSISTSPLLVRPALDLRPFLIVVDPVLLAVELPECAGLYERNEFHSFGQYHEALQVVNNTLQSPSKVGHRDCILAELRRYLACFRDRVTYFARTGCMFVRGCPRVDVIGYLMARQWLDEKDINTLQKRAFVEQKLVVLRKQLLDVKNKSRRGTSSTGASVATAELAKAIRELRATSAEVLAYIASSDAELEHYIEKVEILQANPRHVDWVLEVMDSKLDKMPDAPVISIETAVRHRTQENETRIMWPPFSFASCHPEPTETELVQFTAWFSMFGVEKYRARILGGLLAVTFRNLEPQQYEQMDRLRFLTTNFWLKRNEIVLRELHEHKTQLRRNNQRPLGPPALVAQIDRTFKEIIAIDHFVNDEDHSADNQTQLRHYRELDMLELRDVQRGSKEEYYAGANLLCEEILKTVESSIRQILKEADSDENDEAHKAFRAQVVRINSAAIMSLSMADAAWLFGDTLDIFSQVGNDFVRRVFRDYPLESQNTIDSDRLQVFRINLQYLARLKILLAELATTQSNTYASFSASMYMDVKLAELSGAKHELKKYKDGSYPKIKPAPQLFETDRGWATLINKDIQANAEHLIEVAMKSDVEGVREAVHNLISRVYEKQLWLAADRAFRTIQDKRDPDADKPYAAAFEQIPVQIGAFLSAHLFIHENHVAKQHTIVKPVGDHVTKEFVTARLGPALRNVIDDNLIPLLDDLILNVLDHEVTAVEEKKKDADKPDRNRVGAALQRGIASLGKKAHEVINPYKAAENVFKRAEAFWPGVFKGLQNFYGKLHNFGGQGTKPGFYVSLALVSDILNYSRQYLEDPQYPLVTGTEAVLRIKLEEAVAKDLGWINDVTAHSIDYAHVVNVESTYQIEGSSRAKADITSRTKGRFN